MLIDELRELQNEFCISNCELSRLSGINKSTIGRIMSGKTQPTLAVIMSICDAMGLIISISKK